MLHQISWLTYFLAFIIVAAIYYTVILPLFFSRQIKRFFREHNGIMTSEGATENNIHTAADDYFTYERLRDEITACLEAEDGDAFKSDILFSITSIIKRHPSLQDERFRGALSKEIRRLYNEKYNDSLSGDELTAIWQA